MRQMKTLAHINIDVLISDVLQSKCNEGLRSCHNTVRRNVYERRLEGLEAMVMDKKLFEGYLLHLYAFQVFQLGDGYEKA